MAIYTDNFNRADENPLSDGGNWAGGYTGPGPDRNLQVVGNRVRVANLALNSFETYTGSIGATQYARVKLATANGVAALYLGILLRFSAPTGRSGYSASLAVNDATLRTSITRWDSGVSTDLTTENSTSWATGDEIMFTITGSILRVFRIASGVRTRLLETWDSTYATGRIGIFMANNGILSDLEGDDFQGGDLLVSRQGRMHALYYF